MALALPVAPTHGQVPKIQLPSKTNNTQQKVSPGLSLFAGAIAGGVEAAVTYPFEFSKTRSQLKGGAVQSKNPFATIAHVVRNEGPGALYAGCSTLVLGTAFKASVRFLTFDAIKNSLADENGKLSASRGVLAGMSAGCVESVVAVTPTERIKTALIDDARGQKRFNNGAQALTAMIRESGIREVYRGVLATCAKQSATSAVRMGSYNVLKTAAADHQLPTSSALTFMMGSVAGVITVYATQPFDTIKTRTQAAQGASISQAFRDIMSTSGAVGLWKGSTMRLSRLVLSGGIVFSIYEQVVAVMR